jgi:hypothetical protein
MIAAPRHALVALALLASNAACRGEPTATQPAPSAAAPRDTAAPTTTAPSATAAPSAAAEPEGGLAPNPGCSKRKNSGVMSACEAHKDNLGAWAPTPREVGDVMKLASGVCYCAKDLDVPALACAGRVKSSTVKVTIGAQGDPTDCTLGISAVSWKGRRWVVVNAFNRDVSTFYSILEIYERTKGGFVKYYGGFNGLPDAEALKKGAEGVTPEMKRDWPTLPADVRKAFEGKGP